MADSYTELDSMSGGSKRDAESLTVASNTVQRFRTEIAGSSDVEIVVITNSSPSSTNYGLTTRPVYSTSSWSTKRNSSVTTSAAQITGSSITAIRGVQVTAAITNSNKIYIGKKWSNSR